MGACEGACECCHSKQNQNSEVDVDEVDVDLISKKLSINERQGHFQKSGVEATFPNNITNSSEEEDDNDRREGGFDGLDRRIVDRYEIGLEIYKALVLHGADPKHIRTHGDRTCLMLAVLGEDFNFIEELLKRGVDVNETNLQGETALGIAIKMGRNDIADCLRRKGAR